LRYWGTIPSDNAVVGFIMPYPDLVCCYITAHQDTAGQWGGTIFISDTRVIVIELQFSLADQAGGDDFQKKK